MRESVLTAYIETLRLVYIIGVPCGILAFFGSLLIKNSKMPSKEEEQAQIKAAREKAAALASGAVPSATDAEKGQAAAVLATTATTAEEQDEAAAMQAEGLGMEAGVIPEGAIATGEVAHGEKSAI